MKLTLLGSFTIFAIVAISQTKPSDAVATIKQFYTSYMSAVAKGEEAKLKPLQKQYCTPGLVAKIPKLIRQHEEDPFLNANGASRIDNVW